MVGRHFIVVDVVFSETSDGAGDSERFERLYRAHYAELLRYAARRVDREAAREVVADSFLVAWRRLGEIPADASRAWLYAVARRVLSNELRSGQRRERLATRVQAHTPLDSLTSGDIAQQIADRDEVRALLDQLPAAAREALELIEWDGLSVSEAAQVVGCSVGAFRVRLHRARHRLVSLYRRQQGTGIGIGIGNVEDGCVPDAAVLPSTLASGSWQ